MKNRLFISLDVPSDVLEQVRKIRDSIYGETDSVRWEPVDKLHFTLKFLGDVEEKLIDPIGDELYEILTGYNKFNLTFNTFGLFKNRGVPRILWLGIENNNSLMNLNFEIEKEFVKFGFEKEKRKFHPHLTLLRMKGIENIEKINDFSEYDFPKIDFVADTISIVKSDLKPGGSVYTKIESFKLS